MTGVGILIVNLDRSTDRLALQRKQFQTLSLDFERICATDAKNVSTEQLKRLGFGWNRPLATHEVACLLSHSAAWENIVRSGRPSLILEDDAVLSSRIVEFMRELPVNLHGFDLINLETTFSRFSVEKLPAAKTADVDIYKLYRRGGGSAAYILSSSGARTCLDQLCTVPAPSDIFLSRVKGLNIGQADPALAIALDRMNMLNPASNCLHQSTMPQAARKSTLRKEAHMWLKAPYFKWRRLTSNILRGIDLFRLRGWTDFRVIQACPSIAENDPGANFDHSGSVLFR